jgi:RNA polymerase sigma factor (sigma-70 family)
MNHDSQHRLSGDDLERLIWKLAPDRLRKRAGPLRRRTALPPVAALLAGVSDEGLILAMQKGFFADEAFVELFVTRYRLRLYRWYYRWGVPCDKLDDLVHELILKFKQGRFERYLPAQSSDTFGGYLWKAARNLWLDHLKKEGHRRRPGPLSDHPEPPSPEPEPDHVAIVHELTERLEAAVQLLDQQHQAVFRLALDGMSRGDIAAELKLTKQAVSMRLFRARRFLEERLGLTKTDSMEAAS